MSRLAVARECLPLETSPINVLASCAALLFIRVEILNIEGLKDANLSTLDARLQTATVYISNFNLVIRILLLYILMFNVANIALLI